MKFKLYKSQIGRKDFWWRSLPNGHWMLSRQLYFKNGKPKNSSMCEKELLDPPSSEDALLKVLAQMETDLEFEIANGSRPYQK